MKTILVLGGGGFLAGHIERHFASGGWRVVSVGRKAGAGAAAVHHAWSLPHAEFAHLLAVERPFLCVNAAGRASVPASLIEPLADFEGSALLNFKVLDDLRRVSPDTAYLQLSSAAVYGDVGALPIAECAPVAPISPYGWHKRLAEQILEEHARLFGLRTASLRIFSAYGSTLHRQVVWDLTQRALAGGAEPLLLQGCPEDSRDFIHGDDVAQAIEAVAERGVLAGECYNVATGVETSIADLARQVLLHVGSGAKIRFDDKRRSGNPGRWHADIGRLRGVGFAPTVSLADGVGQVVAAARRLHG